MFNNMSNGEVYGDFNNVFIGNYCSSRMWYQRFIINNEIVICILEITSLRRHKTYGIFLLPISSCNYPVVY